MELIFIYVWRKGKRKKVFPSWNRRGGCAIKKKVPFRSGADGAVAHTKCFSELTTPSAPFKGASRHFIHGASIPPVPGGEYAFPKSFVNSQFPQKHRNIRNLLPVQ